jgi:hypothetical protein
MRRWRTLEQLRQAFRDSGIDLGKPTPRGPGTQQCRGKVRHPTRAHADAVVAEIRITSRDHPRRNDQLGIYQCRWCHFWHFGHTRRWTRKRLTTH